jgi:RNA polymerase sigma factor (sigma-70 family)
MQEDEPGLVRAAQDGDSAALQELLARYVPLLYNLVGRSVSRPADVDDVTQEVLLRAVRDLPELESPASFRSWLTTIAVHQIGDHFRRLEADPSRALDEAGEQAVAFEDLAVLRLDLQGQQRDLARSGRWLDPEHRTLLALWWEECAGRISRAELAAALEVGEAHAAVRLQRMREQLEQSRTIVAALGREPLCPGLTEVVGEWNSIPNPLWRKRISRHVRTCMVCLREAEDQLPAARLIRGLQVLPLPAALIAALIGKGLLAPGAEETELVAEISYDDDDHDEGRWPLARRAGSAIVVVAVVTLLLFTGGFLYDVSQTPGARTEMPLQKTDLSASIVTPSAAPTTPAPAQTSSKPAKKKAVAAVPTAAKGCSPGGSPDPVWAGWTMPNSGEGLPDQHRYTVKPDGTVLDKVTCLVWQRAAAPQKYSFNAAQNYCEGLNLAGGDWRLPTRIELTSLIDTTRSGPAIDPDAFPGTPVSFFWTSSPWATAHDPAFAWIVNFYEGLTSNAADESGEYAVRCVQSHQSGAGKGDPDYAVSEDQVEDAMTGLVWQRGTSGSMTAAKAATYCADLGLGGQKWRLPGVQELATLVDESLVGPAINREAFPSTPARGWYWAANRAAPEKGSRWALNYDDGYTNYRELTSGVVRCVRSV